MGIKSFIVGGLIYYLPLAANLLLSISTFFFLKPADAVIVLGGQFLASAGVGTYSVACSQLPIILAKHNAEFTGTLSRLIFRSFPVTLVGIALLAFVGEREVTFNLLIIAFSLAAIDTVLLTLRTKGFTNHIQRRVPANTSYALYIILAFRTTLSISPILQDLNHIALAFIVVGILSSLYFRSIFGKLPDEILNSNGPFYPTGSDLNYLLLSGFFNGVAPFLLMNGLDAPTTKDGVAELIVLRIALLGNMLIRLVVDTMLATRRVIIVDVALSLFAVVLTLSVLLIGRESVILALLPPLSYISKSTYISRMIDFKYVRTLVTPFTFIYTYLLASIFFNPLFSVISAYILSSSIYVLVYADNKLKFHHTYFVAILCMVGVLIYAKSHLH